MQQDPFSVLEGEGNLRRSALKWSSINSLDQLHYRVFKTSAIKQLEHRDEEIIKVVKSGAMMNIKSRSYKLPFPFSSYSNLRYLGQRAQMNKNDNVLLEKRKRNRGYMMVC